MTVTPLRTIFDTNIYVAAALRPGQYADRWLDIAILPGSGLQLFVSPNILEEVQRKLVDKFGFTESEVNQLIRRIETAARVVRPKIPVNAVPDDPDDNVILECAVEAHAHLIVSADKHLLKLGHYKGIGITHPRELKNIFATDYKEPNQ
jgi:putative PIN family toxin of toxin-antitoxin system